MSRATSSPPRPPAARMAAVRLPVEVTERLLADSDIIARRMARRLFTEIPMGPEYAQRAYLKLVLGACRDALRSLLRQLHDGRRPHPAELAALGAAGALQAEMDVPLDTLLKGYRVAAKVVWREVVDEAVRLVELSPPAVVTLSEQILDYLDSISGAVGAAYLDTRERRLRSVDRERDHLLQRLLNGDASPELRRLAGTLGLELSPPYRLLAVGADGPIDDRRLAGAWREARALVVPDEPDMRIALVDPGADVERLREMAERVLATRVVLAVGPEATTLERVAPAAGRARHALRTGERLEPGRAVHHHAEMGALAAVAADPEGLDAYVDRVLGPLLEPRRADLLATLDAAVMSRGAADTAERLDVHRHTVAYRMGRLCDLLGVDVEDPAQRHRLWLALQLLRLRA